MSGLRRYLPLIVVMSPAALVFGALALYPVARVLIDRFLRELCVGASLVHRSRQLSIGHCGRRVRQEFRQYDPVHERGLAC
ncbi:hypothetical protein OKW46_000557 [Paraburkholderia sp. WSM4179]|nr:hypothetical protein [Paraburkholderia sp. WSM4179]